MPNNIAISITADVADLTAKRAIMSAELKAATTDLNDFAKTARTSGMTAELKTSMLEAATAATEVRDKIASVDKQVWSLRASSGEASAAMEGLHAGSAGVTREMIVMGRELSRGNFSRMAGSATILAQRLNILTPAVAVSAAAIAGMTAPLIALIAAAEQGSSEVAKFQNAIEATNGYAGVTISQLQGMAKELSAFAREGVGAATNELTALVGQGQFTGQTLLLVGEDATRMAQLTGESADKWNTEFAKMSGGVAKFVAEYQAKYGQLTTVQAEYIRQLEEQGQKESAEYQVAKDVHDYLGTKAVQNLGLLEHAWNGVGTAISNAWENLKAFGRDSNADNIRAVQEQIEKLKNGSYMDPADGLLGDGARDQLLSGLEKQLALLRQQEAVEEQKAKTQAQQTATQKDGVAAAQQLSDKFEASQTSGQKLKKALQDINDELAKAVKADPGNSALYEREAAAARSQAMKSDAPRGKDGTVAQWEEDLHQQEIASKDFFGDQTQTELEFWQQKLALTQGNGAAVRQVQAKIYDAQKTLAHQSYDAQLATLNDQLEAGKNNWAEEEALWGQKLAFIKAHYSEQSTEYKNADKEFQAAERQHQQQLAQIAREGAQQALSDLKSNLDAQKQIRQQDAKAAESLIQEQAKDSINPTAQVQAAAQIAVIHQQLLQQELADEQAYQAAREVILQKEAADALAAYGSENENYKKAAAAKLAAEQQFANQVRALHNQMTIQSQQDAQKVEQAWRTAIDPMVSSFGSGIEGMIKGTETLTQALAGVGDAILNVIVTAIERWAAAQIVAMISGQTQGMASAQSQIQANAAVAGSAGVASMAAAPFPIDLGAPGFGAAMSMAAGAYGLASFAVGTNFVPNDMVAQIHAGERIIPAADNAALMSAVSGQPRNAGARPAADDGGNAGVVNIHIHAIDAQSFEKRLEQSGNALQRVLEKHARDGRFTADRRPR